MINFADIKWDFERTPPGSQLQLTADHFQVLLRADVDGRRRAFEVRRVPGADPGLGSPHVELPVPITGRRPSKGER